MIYAIPHTKTTKNNNASQAGFSHIFIPVVIVVALGIGVTAGLVHKASEHKVVNASTTAAATSSVKKSNTNTPATAAKAQAVASTTAAASTPATSTSSAAKTSTTTAHATTSTPASTSANSPTTTQSSSSTVATQTPLSALTAIVASLQAGGSAQVTTNTVTIPGPIGNATGKPIVFSVNGQTYFAYTQEQKPNFNTSASQTASSMAIVNTTVINAPTESAHLDKTNELVNPDIALVGFSTGGN